MRIYIAGPMTGHPGMNFPAFHAAAAEWRNRGWEVVNPAEAFDGATDRPYRDYVEKDLEDLRTCDAVAMLPGWDGVGARGSVWEWAVATHILGINVYSANHPFWAVQRREIGKSVLEEADCLVSGDRQADYGHPIEDFTRTGKIWGAVLGTDPVPPDKVALCMVGVKMSRECNKPKRDNRVDMAGYTKTLDMVREKQVVAHD